MLPIHKVLARIRWDEEFGYGNFVIGYEDRFSPHVIYVALEKDPTRDDRDKGISIRNAAGERVVIPLHRILEVKRNGETIWRRAPGSAR